MKTPKFTFSTIPAMLALFVSSLLVPALNVLRVDARGLGHEHAQPWRSKARAVVDAALLCAGTQCGRLHARFLVLSRHPLFSPAVALTAVALACCINGAAICAAPVMIGLTEGSHAGEFLAWEASALLRESITVLSGQDLNAGAVVGRVSLGIGRVSIPTVVGTGTGTATAVFAGPEVEVGTYTLTCVTAVANNGIFSLVTPGGKTLPAPTMAGGTLVYTSRHINFTLTDSTDFIAGDYFLFIVSTTAPTVIGGTGTGVMTALSLGPDAKPGRYKVINRAVVAEGGDFEVLSPDGDSIGRFLMGTTSTGTAAFTSRQVNFTLSDATDYILGNYFDICVFNQLSGGKVVAWDPTTFDGRHRACGVLYAAIDATSADTAGVIVSRDAAIVKSALSWGAAITSSQKESAYNDLAARRVVARDGVTV